MGNAKAEREELKKLENEAYNELCQIIAEAMQFQDITLLDQRIADWKKKYKKLLDSSSSASSNFKKRIEYLLNEYYSEITQYILKQIRKTEQKRLENQSKILRKLYYIIKETDDLSLLKKKVKEWQDKYPISGFLNMYQKRIKIYTSEKYLKENAFDQDMAFRDLYYITKLNRTYDELKGELAKWEDKYSIHDKFELDDFIKHQSEINRYTSDEYLMSIAHVDNSNDGEITFPKNEIGKENLFSSLSKQAVAYSSLMSIARSPDNIDQIFDWVYKNNSIRFNDEYKDLILSAIYLDYSPRYLNSLSVPKINLSSSLSFEEYENIDEIKRYTVISYFNLLLPPDRRIPNNYFNENIERIYRKSRTAQFSTQYSESNKDSAIDYEIKAISTIIETPELEIDISDEQIFNIPNYSENEDGKLITCVTEDTLAPTHEDTQNAEQSASVEEQIGYILTDENTPIVEAPPKQTESDSLTETATVKAEDKKIVLEKTEREHLDDIHSTVQISEIINPAKDSKQKKDSALELTDSSKPLESDSLSDNEISVNLEEIETTAVIDESKVITSETPIKSQSDDLSVTEENPKIITSESAKPEKKHVEYNSKEDFKMEFSSGTQSSQEEYEDFTPETIIAFSPWFFEIMNNKVNTQKQQSTIVTMINTHVDNYISVTSDRTIDNSKTIADSN